ncbi:50S ribosomal protein L32 [Candidatus Peregrinibacteria bacterium CG22_combo_CG10-13_8_21_14_all_44_10]|nr:MAG: 50S ribosomal protein L32 [Candidatus Peregrinibacteria bacterium CG2_30_44_17]PIP66280.1 MAG: 50S ribosomal protein L32 [Candidatus Peregrinibacteria bacterium CG22_combo_CG10-13_8_21_14_all_44_10]PIS03584.1 MAG: 50S ribosomal protein L32 [Candidatus Peregrinibacteria bacterium CG10_big_fil_rev_8_21_14_0_10_44_7]PIX80620.1 MAG: 50S ribosomal protein L32 [Candidatus Peregrinibacteria bacterium CG_4_10_14_3_um_filter_44_21]PJB88612.1 MAG: 50S ribosomal protein L32 [Candidatus Peregriniba
MAKHPVPKQKLCKSRTSRRYKSFANIVRSKLTDKIQLTTCPSCGEKVRAYHVCEACGQYKNEQIVKSGGSKEKITKIKA